MWIGIVTTERQRCASSMHTFLAKSTNGMVTVNSLVVVCISVGTPGPAIRLRKIKQMEKVGSSYTARLLRFRVCMKITNITEREAAKGCMLLAHGLLQTRITNVPVHHRASASDSMTCSGVFGIQFVGHSVWTRVTLEADVMTLATLTCRTEDAERRTRDREC